MKPGEQKLHQTLRALGEDARSIRRAREHAARSAWLRYLKTLTIPLVQVLRQRQPPDEQHPAEADPPPTAPLPD